MTNVAILGCGAIAQKMATTVVAVPEACAYAVAARDLDRAQAFCQEFGFQKAYGSYAEMLADPAVELVYVAVPHSHHHQCVKLCLEAGKHVLCEKPFTVNGAQARDLMALSKEKNLLLAEAIWTRYMPSRFQITELLHSGIIGEPVSAIANLGYNIMDKARIQDVNLAGGALLDLGVYTLNFARMFFPEPIVSIVSDVEQGKDNVDFIENLSIRFESGLRVLVQNNARAITDRSGSIAGTHGYIQITNTNNPEKIEVFNADYKCIKTVEIEPQITGFEYELLACIRAIQAGEYQCSEMPHSEILYITDWMDKLRAEWNYEIPII